MFTIMKNFILSLVLGITLVLSTSSCISGAYAQEVTVSDSYGDVDVNLVIRYGTPFYFEGSILYYLYDGWYYYPYLHNSYYYYYRYSRPLPLPRHGHHFVPGYNDRPHFRHHRDYRPNRRDTFRPHHGVERRPVTPPRRGFDRPHTPNRGSGTIHRPNTPMRSNSGTMHAPTPHRSAPQIRGGASTPSHGGGSAPHGGGRFGGRR